MSPKMTPAAYRTMLEKQNAEITEQLTQDRTMPQNVRQSLVKTLRANLDEIEELNAAQKFIHQNDTQPIYKPDFGQKVLRQ